MTGPAGTVTNSGVECGTPNALASKGVKQTDLVENVMSYAEVLTQLQSSAVGHAISKSNHMIGATLQILHIFGFVLLLSALIVLSLRLLGLAFIQQPIATLARDVWFGIGLAGRMIGFI